MKKDFSLSMYPRIPFSIYSCKVNNRKNQKRCEICSKLAMKTPERCHCHIVSVFPFLPLNSHQIDACAESEDQQQLFKTMVL